MAERLQHWVWIFDDELARTLLSVQPDNAELARRAASHPAVVGAMRAWMRREPEKALSELSTAVAQANPDALMLAAQIRFELGNLELAAEMYGRLEQVSTGHPYASLNRGLCLARMARWEEAVECLRRAVVLRAGSAEAWFVLGVALLNAKNVAEARAAFGQAVRLRPGYVPALCGEAAALQMDGAFDQAVERYVRLLEASPDQEELLANAAQAAASAGDWAHAKQWAARLAERQPASADALRVLVEVALKEGRFNDAARHCVRLTEIEPAGFTHWYNLGVCHQHLGRAQDAALAFDSALRIDQSDAEAWEGLATSLLESGDRAGGKSAWRLALERRPSNAEGWLRLGLLYAADDELDEVERMLAAARSAGPIPEQVRPLEAALLAVLGAARHSSGDLDQAAQLYQEALALTPNDPDVHFNLGSVLAGLGRQSEAGEQWKTAIAARPELARTLLESL